MPTFVELNACLHGIIEKIGKSLGPYCSRNISVRSDAETIVISAMQQWELVLADELIQNAMSFSPPGTEIRVSLSLERSRVALFVDHDGPSIDPRTCLLPFHRLHRKLGENDDVYDSRIGIGLTLLDLMARRSGWSLEFVEGNAGTRPVLMMPVS